MRRPIPSTPDATIQGTRDRDPTSSGSRTARSQLHAPGASRAGASHIVEMHVAAPSDVGMVRSGNEDSFFAHATKGGGLFIVADGMGGHAAGEVASEMAVQIVSRELGDLHHLTGQAPREKVAESIRSANRAIYERTISESDKQGMGTTVSVLLVSGARWLIGQVGDSRIYLLRDGALTQLTKDHSYVQEQVDAGLLTPEQARYHPYSNVITRCVGASEEVEADTFSGEFRSEERRVGKERRNQ